MTDRIRRELERRAAAVDVTPDFEDLTDRMARRDRRRVRVLTSALVLALFGGPVLGFVVGRGDREDDAPARVPAATAGRADGVTVERDVELPKLGADDVLAGAPGPPLPGDAVAELGAAAARGYNDITWSSSLVFSHPDMPLARVFVRDLDGGIRIRAYRAEVEVPAPYGPPWWEPAPWCFPNGIVQADVSTDAVVGITMGNLFAERRDGKRVGGTLGLVGVAEQAPAWVAVVQAPADAAQVRVTFPGGATDAMVPVDGVAVLVAGGAQVPGDGSEAQAVAETLDANGAVVERAELGGFVHSGGLLDDAFEVPDEGCYGPMELPPPGEEQPADPAAARAEIEAHYGRRAGDLTMEERLAGIDDPRGMEQVWNELLNGPYAQQVRDARSVLRDVVFLSATRAAVQYDVTIENYTDFPNRFAEHVFVDGRWKLTRESICNDISLAGVTCPPVE